MIGITSSSEFFIVPLKNESLTPKLLDHILLYLIKILHPSYKVIEYDPIYLKAFYVVFIINLRYRDMFMS